MIFEKCFLQPVSFTFIHISYIFFLFLICHTSLLIQMNVQNIFFLFSFSLLFHIIVQNIQFVWWNIHVLILFYNFVLYSQWLTHSELLVHLILCICRFVRCCCCFHDDSVCSQVDRLKKKLHPCVHYIQVIIIIVHVCHSYYK